MLFPLSFWHEVPVHCSLSFSSDHLAALGWSGLLRRQSVSSHVKKHDLSSPMKPCSPVTSSLAHLCGIPSVSSFKCVRIQSRLTSCLSISILLSHVGKILVLSLLLAQGGLRPACPSRNPLSVSKAMRTLPIHLTISMFPLLARLN